MKATLRRGNKLLLQEGKLTRKAGSYIQPCRKKPHKITSLLLLEKVEISTRLNDHLCSLSHGLFHLLSFPFEIISSSKEGKNKKISLFLLQDEEEETQREGRRKQRNFLSNKTKPKQQK